MSANPEFDRWYAARHVKMLVTPSHHLETFGSTLVNYWLVSELEDRPGKVRVREGRLEAHRPLVIAPGRDDLEMPGFGPEARAYMAFLREHEENLRILRYGFSLKSDNFSEQVVTDSVEAVAERVKGEVEAKRDPFAAVLQGEDEPWDVSLVELWRREVMRSARHNIRELRARGDLF